MSAPTPDTIFALSSAPGRAGVAVIRVSGPDAGRVLDQLAGGRPKPRYAALRILRRPGSAEVLDQALVLWFPAPRSETGEDLAELHLHGGRAVIAAVIDALATITGCRLARPGEFARRAFENGKVDLVQVEGLADLVEAETEAQRRQALAQTGGVLSRVGAELRAELIEIAALTEAAIDFSDEADVVARIGREAEDRVRAVLDRIAALLDDGRRGEILREGFRVTLAGAPNAGKSTLLNALAGREAAIVSHEPGTTRDVIEVRLDLGGYPVIVSDTAGIRAAEGAIEQEGIRRSLATARAADLVLWLVGAGAPVAPSPATIKAMEAGDPLRLVMVASKCDLGRVTGDAAIVPAVSALTGEGIGALVEEIARRAAQRLASGEAAVITRARHRELLERCRDALSDYLTGDAGDAELRAEDVRRAVHALEQLIGRVDVEDVLEQVFGRFCIGK